MTLVDIIRKALDNGWTIPFEEPILDIKISQDEVNGTHQVLPYVLFELDGPTDWAVGIPHIIFNHDFAKALWDDGTETGYQHECEVCGCDTSYWVPTWQFRLQEMVIADDPVKYLEKHV